MKKTALALSIACAGALAFADNPQWNTAAWITGIGSSASSLTSLDATGGSWGDTLTEDNAEFSTADKSIELDLDTDDEAVFTVSTESAPDAKTAQKLTITGVFTPTAAADLLAGSAMGSGEGNKNAQFGFAVVSTTETSQDENTETTTTYGYYAWVGASGGLTPIEDWTKIADCSDPTVATTVIIEASYWAGSPKVTFTIGETSKTYELTDDAATAAAANKIASVACTGSGTLSTLSGVTGIAVASVGDTVYPTVADAITAAASQTDTTVKLEADPSGEVTIPEGQTVKIDDNGKTAEIENKGTVDVVINNTAEGATAGEVPSGEYTIPVKVSGNNVTYTPSDSSKEVLSATKTEDGSSVKVVVQTKTSILEAITIEGATLKSDVSELRKFLAANCSEAYTQAKTSSEIIATALKVDGDNNLKKWQSYALGIATDTTLAPSYATSDTGDKITIALTPSAGTISPSGDFTIKYQVTNGGGTTTTATSANAIQVPLETGRYTVNVVFSAPEGN